MGWWGWGSLRDLSKNILKQGWVKAKVDLRGEGLLKVSSPLPPRKLLIIHEVSYYCADLSFNFSLP